MRAVFATLLLTAGCGVDAPDFDARGAEDGRTRPHSPGFAFATDPGDVGDHARPHQSLLPLDAAAVDEARAVVTRALARWPAGLVGQAVDHVVLVEDLYVDGDAYRGFAYCDGRTMFVRVRRSETAARVVYAVHHELTHLLHCDTDLDQDAWTALSDDPADALSTGDDEALAEAGYVSAYASGSPAEDLAEVVAQSVTDPARVAALAQRHPAILHKLRLANAWLAARDPAAAAAALGPLALDLDVRDPHR